MQDKKQAVKIESRPQVVKKEKGKGKAAKKRNRVEEDQSDGQDDHEDSGQESDDENARMEVTNFKDQPLGRAEAQKLRGLASDWRDIDKKIQQSWVGVRQVAVAMAGAVEDEEGEQSLEELDAIMRELIDVSAEMNTHEQALDEIYQLIGRGEQISNTLDRYQGAVNAKAREYTQKTARQKYAKNEQYVKFKEDIFGILHPDLPMRPITELIQREDGDASDDEDDIEVGGVTQDYKCPITLTPFVDPLTSSGPNLPFLSMFTDDIKQDGLPTFVLS
ncbi:hypothetical protein APHAL10511_002580 [Amanita phalloides]|nr:hypothetical protein APHAL10511_002580 [Amanita phalloides]